MKNPQVGTTLYDEDLGEYSLVVAEPDADSRQALVDLLHNAGLYVTVDHPIVKLKTRELGLEAQQWFSCTKRYKESNDLAHIDYDYWAPDGDGKRSIWVVCVPQSLETIIDLIEVFDEGAKCEITPLATSEQLKLKRQARRKLWLKAYRKTQISWREWSGLDNDDE